MGLLQGPRLMAWTTKSPIQGNHWVPLGCRALLVSAEFDKHIREIATYCTEQLETPLKVN